MKVGAHPLVVAVALGLVGPQILEEAESPETTKPCADCDETIEDGLTDALATQLLDAADTTLHQPVDWSTMDAPSAEDFDRVALAFEKARGQV
ncbi:MAG: hypothetical protein AAGA48_16195 [Myxococcota bacterium]